MEQMGTVLAPLTKYTFRRFTWHSQHHRGRFVLCCFDVVCSVVNYCTGTCTFVIACLHVQYSMLWLCRVVVLMLSFFPELHLPFTSKYESRTVGYTITELIPEYRTSCIFREWSSPYVWAGKKYGPELFRIVFEKHCRGTTFTPLS